MNREEFLTVTEAMASVSKNVKNQMLYDSFNVTVLLALNTRFTDLAAADFKKAKQMIDVYFEALKKMAKMLHGKDAEATIEKEGFDEWIDSTLP